MMIALSLWALARKSIVEGEKTNCGGNTTIQSSLRTEEMGMEKKSGEPDFK